MEFMQKAMVGIIVSAFLLVVLAFFANFILLWNGKEQMENATIAIITTFGTIISTGATAVYGAVNAIRAWSANKHVDGPCKLEQIKQEADE